MLTPLAMQGVSVRDLIQEDKPLIDPSDPTRLNLAKKDLTDLTGLQEIKGIENVETLILSNNKLTTLPVEAFKGFSKLGWLFLDNNQLATLPVDVFKDLHGLYYLDLKNNKLTSLPWLFPFNNNPYMLLLADNPLDSASKRQTSHDVELQDLRQKEEPQVKELQRAGQFATHVLLILLGNSTDKEDTVVMELFTALKQKAAPILTTTKLFSSLFDKSFEDDEWLIYNVDKKGALLLFIPKSYLKDLGSDTNYAQQPDNSPPSEREYSLGLKIDHMKPALDLLSFVYSHINTINYASYEKALLQSLWDPTQEKRKTITVKDETGKKSIKNYLVGGSALFVTRADYALAHKEFSPRWAVSLMGHGRINRSICDLSIPAFTHVLDFFDTKIETRLLYLVSCYLLGTNMDQATTDQTSHLQKTYSFPILTNGIIDRRVASHPSKFSFESFVQKVTDTTTPNFHALASTLSYQSDLDDKYRGFVFVRLPGTSWFKLEDPDQSIASLGSVFAQTCSKTNLARRFTVYSGDATTKKATLPVYFLLYTNTIPCELIITKELIDKKAVFIAMVKMEEDKKYRLFIKKISAPDATLKDILAMFTLKTPGQYGNFDILIDTLETKDFPQLDSVVISIPSSSSSEELPARGSVYYFQQKEAYLFDLATGMLTKQPDASYKTTFSKLFDLAKAETNTSSKELLEETLKTKRLQKHKKEEEKTATRKLLEKTFAKKKLQEQK